MTKTQIINAIIDREGSEYTNDPADSGGATKWGVTEKEARATGYTGDMRVLPRAFAERIFGEKFWDSVDADHVGVLSERVRDELVDTAVNCGPNRAIMFLQRSLNALRGDIYEPLVVDGRIGNETLYRLQAFLVARAGNEDEEVLLRVLNGLQCAFYVGLTETRAKDLKWFYGWIRARVRI
jgi:lysozyme family protein